MCNLQQRMRVKVVLYLGPQAPPTTQQGAGAQPRDEKLAGCKSCNTKSESRAVESGPWGHAQCKNAKPLCEHACTSRHTSASNTGSVQCLTFSSAEKQLCFFAAPPFDSSLLGAAGPY